MDFVFRVFGDVLVVLYYLLIVLMIWIFLIEVA